jgi:ABC-type transport system involved in cytochrome bd biosynthesis fused ATPase/permease subunit
VLNDVQLSVKRGELLVVVGSVGAGKSSLLSAILGELGRCDGGEANERAIHIPNDCRLAYCSQRPWILATSVRSNITLAGKSGDVAANPHLVSDQSLYDLALDSCRLREDMNQWLAMDLTEIGERGVSISGGQRARVALARAVYSDADRKTRTYLAFPFYCPYLMFFS